MNVLEERHRNRNHIAELDGGEFKILEVDTHQCTYQGRKWRNLDSFEKRKFENILFIEEGAEQPIKIKYY